MDTDASSDTSGSDASNWDLIYETLVFKGYRLRDGVPYAVYEMEWDSHEIRLAGYLFLLHAMWEPVLVGDSQVPWIFFCWPSPDDDRNIRWDAENECFIDDGDVVFEHLSEDADKEGYVVAWLHGHETQRVAITTGTSHEDLIGSMAYQPSNISRRYEYDLHMSSLKHAYEDELRYPREHVAELKMRLPEIRAIAVAYVRDRLSKMQTWSVGDMYDVAVSVAFSRLKITHLPKDLMVEWLTGQ